MLKCSNILRNQLKYTVTRSYHYQNDIYTINEPILLTNLNDIRKEIEDSNDKIVEQPNLYRYIKAYRQYGFKISKINPLENKTKSIPFELDPNTYGLDRNISYSTNGLLFSNKQNFDTLADIEKFLQNTYSKEMSIEIEHIRNEEEKYWLAKEYEKMQEEALNANTKINILKLLAKSQAFDQFLGLKFPTFKRYSLEGGESAMAFYESFFSNCAKSDLEQVVMGIAHRGRLNLMVLMLDLSPALLFNKIKGKSEFSSDITVNGDISHHFPCSTDMKYENNKIHVSLLPNPSHLEAVDPLVLGKARSKQMFLRDGYYSNTPTTQANKVIPFLIHGDAAFAGQGVVMETLQFSSLPNYSVGGVIHLIINNQLGFTATSNLGRSGLFNSDQVRSIDCPVIHINGDNPELAYKAAQLAIKYRNTFAKDILVDLICYRRWGHNELDEPSFTQPKMYEIINNRKSVPTLYEEKIINEEKLCGKEEIDTEVNKFREHLDNNLKLVTEQTYKIEPRNTYLKAQWSAMTIASDKEKSTWDTGCDIDLLRFVGAQSVTIPKDFKIHPTIDRGHIKRRIERIKQQTNIDWSTAESLAFGSLLAQGFNIRLSGQDVGRGTFSQRHALLIDQETNQTYIPLNNLSENQNNYLEICNSHLSEEAVMGFDFGFSLDNPKNLVIWEAQFGDFFNGAQIIIDTFISSSETKWLYQSGMVLLLPHGYDGAGPEHTSCRIERFLQSCSSKENVVDSDNVNYYITHPTTPANFFHLIRRQMVQPYRKPLIVASPKLLIRLPECISTLDEMGPNTSFKPVISDPNIKSKEAVKRVIFVFGKHYYALATERDNRKLNDVAIVRIEELCPFPVNEIRNAINEYKNVNEFIWAQEEHQNMGGWFFVKPRFENLLGIKLHYAGRDVNCTPAVGIGEMHNKEVKYVLSKPFEKL